MILQRRTGFQEVATGAFAMITSIIVPEGGGPNAGFIVIGGEAVVIDTLISIGTAKELLGHVRGIIKKRPMYVIITHGHGDHVIGNQVFSPPTRIIAHETVREALLQQGHSIIDHVAQRHPDLVQDLKEARIVTPDISYRDHMTLHIGGCTVELIHPGPAHSLGDTMVYFAEQKVLYAGDIVFNHSLPAIFGDTGRWIAALEQIESMDIKAIVPGHGFVCTRQEVSEFKQCLIELRRQAKSCYDRKLSKKEALTEIGAGVYRDWPHQERLVLDVDQFYKEFENTPAPTVRPA